MYIYDPSILPTIPPPQDYKNVVGFHDDSPLGKSSDKALKAMDKYINSTHLFKSNVLNIGGGSSNTLSLLELIEILEGFLDKKLKVKFHEWRPSDQKVYISDIDKVSYALDWKPQVGVKEGVRKTYDWVKSYLEP